MLVANNIVKTYQMKNEKGGTKIIHAVNGVDLRLVPGEFCALVGESGSGKSTLTHLLMGFISPTTGEVLLDGKSINTVKKRSPKAIYSKIQLVLQDGKSSLDPRLTVYDSIAEPIRNLMKLKRLEEKHRVMTLMEKMELSSDILTRKAHELSGGQQKRVCIARALAAEPELIIFDEAVSGLDVLVRKSILDLLKRLYDENKLSFLFITHDMDVALYLANRILVMKDGKIIEQVWYQGDNSCFIHPYSRLLLASRLPHVSREQSEHYTKVI